MFSISQCIICVLHRLSIFERVIIILDLTCGERINKQINKPKCNYLSYQINQIRMLVLPTQNEIKHSSWMLQIWIRFIYNFFIFFVKNLICIIFLQKSNHAMLIFKKYVIIFLRLYTCILIGESYICHILITESNSKNIRTYT